MDDPPGTPEAHSSREANRGHGGGFCSRFINLHKRFVRNMIDHQAAAGNMPVKSAK